MVEAIGGEDDLRGVLYGCEEGRLSIILRFCNAGALTAMNWRIGHGRI